MKKSKIMIPITIGIVLIAVIFVAGIIMTIINDGEIGFYMILFVFALMFICASILIQSLLFKVSKKAVLIIILISACMTIGGAIIGYKGIDEQKDKATVLEINSSKVTIKYQEDVQIIVKKPILKKIDEGEEVDIYYDKDNIDSIRLISYANIGDSLFGMGLYLPFIGGIITIIVIAVLENSKKRRRKK